MRKHPQAVRGTSTARRAARAASLAVLVLALALLALPGAPGAGADSGTYVRARAALAGHGRRHDLDLVGRRARPRRHAARRALRRALGVPAHRARRLRRDDRGAGNATTPVVSSALKAEAGSSYTLASVGAADKRALAVFDDDLTAPPTGRARVRVINAAPPAPVLDVRGPGGAPFSHRPAPGTGQRLPHGRRGHAAAVGGPARRHGHRPRGAGGGEPGDLGRAGQRRPADLGAAARRRGGPGGGAAGVDRGGLRRRRRPARPAARSCCSAAWPWRRVSPRWSCPGAVGGPRAGRVDLC